MKELLKPLKYGGKSISQPSDILDVFSYDYDILTKENVNKILEENKEIIADRTTCD